MRFGLLAVVPIALTLVCCGRSASSADQATSRPVRVIEAAWNDAAASRIQSLVARGKFQYTLPELRIYDASQKLIFRQIGDSPTIDGAMLNREIAADRPVSGPTFSDTVGDLDTADHRPAAAKLPANGEVTIFDYWAEWCASCKVLGKRLTNWTATQPEGAVRIVKAEADLQKILARTEPENGHTVVKRVSSVSKGPDGKVHTVVTRTVTTTVDNKRS